MTREPSFNAMVTPEVVRWSVLLVNSYFLATGRSLLSAVAEPFTSMASSAGHELSGEDVARVLFEMPAVVVSHGLQAEPLLNYGNAAALNLWQMCWADFVMTPSSATAEIAHREERLAAFARVRATGFVDGYEGVRTTATGERFTIIDGTIWEVVDEQGVRHGDAATFQKWTTPDHG